MGTEPKKNISQKMTQIHKSYIKRYITTNNQGNSNKNHNEMLPHTC